MVSPTGHLEAVASDIEQTGWAAHLLDSGWRLVWVSPELRRLLGSDDEDELGYGRHILEAYQRELWTTAATQESQLALIARDIPFMIDATEGGKDALKRMLPRSAWAWLESLEPQPAPAAWASRIEILQGDLPPAPVRLVTAQLHGPAVERLGLLRVYGSALPATVLALVARGDEAMFGRMARLFEPRPRQAALLFADLQSSGSLSRNLPTAAYFRLIRHLTTAIDDAVIQHQGIVGKHAGDGVTAFFLVDDLGSTSAAATAAIQAARIIAGVCDQAADVTDGLVTPDECRFNVGLHWGATLYMGQVVTGGRIEVTALGDEVNEAARVQQSARDGELLVSKNLVERLSAQDGASLGIEPDRLVYRALAELEGATDKAIRDAGTIAVCDLRSAEQAAGPPDDR